MSNIRYLGKYPTWIIFLGVFIVALIVQIPLFQKVSFSDNTLWTLTAEEIARGYLPQGEHATVPHPGTTVLLPIAALIFFNVDTHTSLIVSMAILLASSIAIIAYLCFLLRPHDLWWLGAAFFLIPNVQYSDATPPTALAALLTAIYILLILVIRKFGARNDLLFWLGLCGGVLLATRIDDGAAIILLSLPYLWYFARSRIAIVFATSLLFFWALNPYMSVDPLMQLQTFANQVAINANIPSSIGHRPAVFLFSCLSFFLGFIFLYALPRVRTLPRDFLLWLMLISCVIVGIKMSASYHPFRYFFPIMTVWETFLPLFLLELLETLRRNFTVKILYLIQYSLIGFLLFGRIAFTYFHW